MINTWPPAIEPRQITRFEVKQWAREAYNLGVRFVLFQCLIYHPLIRYIGGCCGFEPYLIRAIAEELAEERKCLPYSSRL